MKVKPSISQCSQCNWLWDFHEDSGFPLSCRCAHETQTVQEMFKKHGELKIPENDVCPGYNADKSSPELKEEFAFARTRLADHGKEWPTEKAMTMI